LALKRCPDYEHVVAIDINPMNCAVMMRTAKENGLAPRIICVGVADTPGYVACENFQSTANTTICSTGSIAPALPLDQLLTVLPVRCGLLKLDIEGAELRALAGAEMLIHRDRPYIIMEWLGHLLPPDAEQRFADWISSHDYRWELVSRNDQPFRLDHLPPRQEQIGNTYMLLLQPAEKPALN
jgi:FkbM family methyltransferase